MSEDKEYNCDQCDKEYKSRAGLWKHQKAKHSETETQTEPTVKQEVLLAARDLRIEILIKKSLQCSGFFNCHRDIITI